MKHYISYGAGIGSTGMICHLYDSIDQYEIIFVNHGADYPYTYDYVDYIQHALGIKIHELRPNIEGQYDNLYDYLAAHNQAPNRRCRFCGDKAKIRTIRQYVVRPSVESIGITFDEQHRAIPSDVSYLTNKYPMVEDRITRRDAIGLIKSFGIKVPKRSCCYICFNAGNRELSRLKQEYPDLWKRREALYLNERLHRHERQGQTILPGMGPCSAFTI
jgi:hypothetical protein